MRIKATSVIEISQSAYKNNIKYLRELLGPGVRISSVVKGDAYGHGVANIIPLAERQGIDHFSVFSADEAFAAVQAASKGSEIMVMGHINDDDELVWMIEEGVSFFVFHRERLERAIALARQAGRVARVHLEIETGFNRTGLALGELEQVAALLLANGEHVQVAGVCTHYAGAESVANHLRVNQQIGRFYGAVQTLTAQGLGGLLRHTACSAAALTYPETRMEMVRVGIAQYGFWPSQETFIFRYQDDLQRGRDLKRLISWKSRVMAVKEVGSGEFIGYGNTFLTNRPMKLAIVPVGYANGFSRSLSNNGHVLVRGKRVSVVGNVTMNTITVGVTDVPNVAVGDEVVLIGKQKGQAITVASFCEMSNQLNYQLLARLPEKIPRVVVR